MSIRQIERRTLGRQARDDEARMSIGLIECFTAGSVTYNPFAMPVFEARSLGYGGIRRVSRASGISHTAIRRALKQLDAPPPPAGRARRPGGGRKKVRDKSPAILAALEELIAPETRGDPMSPLRWTCKSTQRLAEELTRRNHPVSAPTVAVLPVVGPGAATHGNPRSAPRTRAP